MFTNLKLIKRVECLEERIRYLEKIIKIERDYIKILTELLDGRK